jgi:glycosyltransferase involved in cell wall biosynthesis
MSGRFDPRGIQRLIHLIRQENIDILHTHGYKSDLLGWIAARLAGIKIISTPHGFENAKDFKLQLFIKLGIISMKFMDQVAPLSEGIQTDLLRAGIQKDKIRLILNGVDLDELRNGGFEDEPKPVNPKQPKTIGYVGQLASRKNVIDIIRTFDLLFQEYQDIQLILIGDGPLQNELQRYAQSLSCADKIKFLGYREDRIKIMKRFDLFCMSSSLEGIPRAMMEAMALGIPVAAYRIEGIDRLIVDNETGVLAEFGDYQHLKHCWKTILYDQDFADRISCNGKNHIEKNYSARRMADEYMQLFREIME